MVHVRHPSIGLFCGEYHKKYQLHSGFIVECYAQKISRLMNMKPIKILMLAILNAFCMTSYADDLVPVSVGISLETFVKQGGRYEREAEFYGDRYRINLEEFRNCSPTEVIANAMHKKRTLLRVLLVNKNGWYEFGIDPEKHKKEMVYIQIHCAEGIPYRNIWL